MSGSPSQERTLDGVVGIAFVVRVLIAVGIVVAIAVIGLSFLAGVASSRPKRRIEPEDVASLDVFFVCVECGTEFQVTRLGEVQIPRHCGEPMRVERRPRQGNLTG
jgi:hypothetical protein